LSELSSRCNFCAVHPVTLSAATAFYARLNPGLAAAGGGLYLLIVLGASWRSGPPGAYACTVPAMAAGSLTACALLLIALRPILATDSSAIRGAADHCAMANGSPLPLARWVTDNIYYIVLPAWVGLTEAGD